MKSTQKGNQYEREVRDILESQGWLVEGQHRKVMWIKDKFTGQMKMLMSGRDIFGCDLICKKQGYKSRWLQVSVVAQKSAKEKQVLAFPWTLMYEDVELWLRIEGKRAYRVFSMEFDGGGYVFIEKDQQLCVKGDNNAKQQPA